jgi:hypothetical protein
MANRFEELADYSEIRSDRPVHEKREGKGESKNEEYSQKLYLLKIRAASGRNPLTS